MGRPRKVPAVLVEATVRTNAKLAELPSDAARLGFFYVVLGDAKLAAPVPGQFLSRGQFREVAGRFARFLEDYVRVGILEVAPKLCQRCRTSWSTMPPRAGALVVHDWHEHQYDPRRLERQREYDDRQRLGSDASGEGVSDAVSDAQSDALSDRNGVRNGVVSDGVSDADSRAHVGARGRPGAVNVERRTENVESLGSLSVQVPPGGREGTREKKSGWASVGAVVANLDQASEHWTTSLTLEERDEWAGYGEEWDAFRDAWLQRGFRHPPKGTAEDNPDDENPSQRALLYSILRDRPNDVPRWIREAPSRASASQVVGFILGRWHDIRDQAAPLEPAKAGPFS